MTTMHALPHVRRAAAILAALVAAIPAHAQDADIPCSRRATAARSAR